MIETDIRNWRLKEQSEREIIFENIAAQRMTMLFRIDEGWQVVVKSTDDIPYRTLTEKYCINKKYALEEASSLMEKFNA